MAEKGKKAPGCAGGRDGVGVRYTVPVILKELFLGVLFERVHMNDYCKPE